MFGVIKVIDGLIDCSAMAIKNNLTKCGGMMLHVAYWNVTLFVLVPQHILFSFFAIFQGNQVVGSAPIKLWNRVSPQPVQENIFATQAEHQEGFFFFFFCKVHCEIAMLWWFRKFSAWFGARQFHNILCRRTAKTIWCVHIHKYWCSGTKDNRVQSHVPFSEHVDGKFLFFLFFLHSIL